MKFIEITHQQRWKALYMQKKKIFANAKQWNQNIFFSSQSPFLYFLCNTFWSDMKEEKSSLRVNLLFKQKNNSNKYDNDEGKEEKSFMHAFSALILIFEEIFLCIRCIIGVCIFTEAMHEYSSKFFLEFYGFEVF